MHASSGHLVDHSAGDFGAHRYLSHADRAQLPAAVVDQRQAHQVRAGRRQRKRAPPSDPGECIHPLAGLCPLGPQLRDLSLGGRGPLGFVLGVFGRVDLSRGGAQLVELGEAVPVGEDGPDHGLCPAPGCPRDLAQRSVAQAAGVVVQEVAVGQVVGLQMAGPAVQAHSVDDRLVGPVLSPVVHALRLEAVPELHGDAGGEDRAVPPVLGDDDEGAAHVRGADDVSDAAVLEDGDAGRCRAGARQRQLDALGQGREGQGTPMLGW